MSDVLRKTFDKMLEARYEALSEEDKEHISLDEYDCEKYLTLLFFITIFTFFYYSFFFAYFFHLIC